MENVNVLVTRVPVKLLDGEHHLVFDVEACALIDSMFPGEKSSLSPEFWEGFDARKLPVILWAGLHYDEPNLTLDKTRELMRGIRAMGLFNKITEAWVKNAPEEQANPTLAVAEKKAAPLP